MVTTTQTSPDFTVTTSVFSNWSALLQQLLDHLNASPDKVASAVDEVGITFLFASGWHPALKAVLQGKGTQAQRDVVALNAALALQVGEVFAPTTDIIEVCRKGITIASDILQSGAAWTKLEKLAQFLL